MLASERCNYLPPAKVRLAWLKANTRYGPQFRLDSVRDWSPIDSLSLKLLIGLQVTIGIVRSLSELYICHFADTE